MTSDEIVTLKELFTARFDALEARMVSMFAVLDKDNNRQDEAIERQADRSTSHNETKLLVERVVKLESQVEQGRIKLGDLIYKMRIIVYIGTALAVLSWSILTALVKGWVGV